MGEMRLEFTLSCRALSLFSFPCLLFSFVCEGERGAMQVFMRGCTNYGRYGIMDGLVGMFHV